MRKHLVLVGALIVASCGPTIQSRRDVFQGYTINESRGNTLHGGGLGLATVQLDPQVMTFDVGATGYRLLLRYHHSDWLFIRSGESLGLNIDGETQMLSGQGSAGGNRDVRSGGNISEAAVYLVPPALICQLAEASSVQVRAYGRTKYTDRSFSPDNFEAYKAFVAAHMSPEECADDRPLNADQLVDSIKGEKPDSTGT